MYFISEFGGDVISSRAYWASEIMDLPFLGMPSEACLSTVCPATPNQKQTYTVMLPISKKFPAVSNFSILLNTSFYLMLYLCINDYRYFITYIYLS